MTKHKYLITNGNGKKEIVELTDKQYQQVLASIAVTEMYIDQAVEKTRQYMKTSLFKRNKH